MSTIHGEDRPMQCAQCGYQLTDEAAFCSRCGAPVNRPGVLWEYKIVKITKPKLGFDYSLAEEHEPLLNQLGYEGWELVGFTADPGGSGSATAHSLVFKRRVLGKGWAI